MAATRVVAILGLAFLAACAGKDAAAPPEAAVPAAAKAEPPTREQLLSATVSGVLPETVTLSNGRHDGPPAQAGAASRTSLVLMEPTVLFGDVDGQPPSEAVALLVANTGGSGEFVHVGVFAMRDGKAQTIATAPVGDRVKVFRTWLERDKLHMDVVEARPDDPACCPTQLTRKAFGWQDGTLAMLENAPVGYMSIHMLAATDWMLVEMDGQPLPQGLMPPTALIQYGKITGFAGCNRYTGPLAEPEAGKLDVGEVAATKKACEGPANDLEARFLERLGKVDAYTFQAGRLVLSGPPLAQGAPATLVFSR
ncbi:MAG TPA: META domain-containing protein [Steroidobacteraceae bacterium]|nr:META domain-containing protein [Steroidobacteraceae bacterium]